MDAAATRRKLKIQAGVAKRVFKEHEIYGNEVVENKIKLDKLRAEGEEDWGVRNAAKLVEESKKMVVNTDQRLRKAVEDLRDVIVLAKKDPAFAEDEELMKAEEVFETVSA